MKAKISPSCRRITLDIPLELHERIKKQADAPPAIPFSEWCRRVLAHHAKYPMPPLTERQKGRLRLDGTPKRPRRPEE